MRSSLAWPTARDFSSRSNSKSRNNQYHHYPRTNQQLMQYCGRYKCQSMHQQCEHCCQNWPWWICPAQFQYKKKWILQTRNLCVCMQKSTESEKQNRLIHFRKQRPKQPLQACKVHYTRQMLENMLATECLLCSLLLGLVQACNPHILARSITTDTAHVSCTDILKSILDVVALKNACTLHSVLKNTRLANSNHYCTA